MHLLRFSRLKLLTLLLAVSVAPVQAEDFQGSTHKVPFDEEVIRYSETPAQSVIEELQEKINRGEVKLHFDDTLGYLPAILEALKVPITSQLLVFSKTSLQRTHISPTRPRALYFNDDVYIGFIPGAPLLEISVADPKLGGVFYELDQTKLRKPKIVRSNECLQCHASSRTLGVPGHIVRSIGTTMAGELDVQTEVTGIDHCTPLADRWAGWYVTGTHGEQTHRGNLVGPKALDRQVTDPNHSGNLEDLSRFFNVSSYLAPGSDIVAHLVLDHQSHMHNYITRLNLETQIMMAQYGHIRYLDRQVDAFLRYLLFTEEAPLKERIHGDEEFIKEFASRGPRDEQGRSLRDFDLKKRLFKFPCSFLIYSDAFDSMPAVMKDHLLQRLWDILNGADKSADFARLTEEDRTAVREILVATKPNLPSYWRSAVADGG